MKNKSLFKYFLLTTCLGIVLTCAGSLVSGKFVKTNIENVSAYNDKNEFYCKKGFDLIVKGPSMSQIESFKSNENITKCIPYLEIDLNMKINDKINQNTVLVFDDFNDLQYSELTRYREIESSNLVSNSVGIDFKFSKNNGLSLNDEFTMYIDGAEQICKVSTIFKTDYIFTKGIVVTTTNLVSSSFKTFAYLKTNNIVSLKKQFEDYIPMGTLLPKSEYQTDEQYQKYLDEFYSKDYFSTHILDYGEEMIQNNNVNLPKAESSKKSMIISSVVFAVFLSLISLFFFFVVAKNKNDFIYKQIKDNGNKTSIIGYSVQNGLMLFVSLVCSFITIISGIHSTSVFISFGSAFISNLIFVFLPVACILASYLFIFLKIRKV